MDKNLLAKQIKEIEKTCLEALKSTNSSAEILELKANLFGKSGELTALKRGLKDALSEERPVLGAIINEASDNLENLFNTKIKEAVFSETNQKLKGEKLDITIPAPKLHTGALHPLSQMSNQIIGLFTSMGFSVLEGPEIETDFFCFEALNMPKHHPARDMQDTFYIQDEIVLRTHTSPMQVRTMLATPPPIKMINPGRVYRSDSSARHSPMFSQIEGLVIDKKVTLADLFGTLELFAKQLFGESTKVRFRPSYFPFTEPSVEVDASCMACASGKGCPVCKDTGWIEILGAGMVHPKVLQNCGIDTKVYKGFAFGMGVERITMLKFGITDIRLLFENDIRFLKQF